jgi:hypothetical protein
MTPKGGGKHNWWTPGFPSPCIAKLATSNLAGSVEYGPLTMILGLAENRQWPVSCFYPVYFTGYLVGSFITRVLPNSL